MGAGNLNQKQLIFTTIGAIAVVAISLYYYQVFFHFDKFLPGVRIASVDVSGLDAREATARVEEWFEISRNTEVTFHSDDYSYGINLKELCLKPDAAQIVGEVWEKERHRGIKSKILSMDGHQATKYPVKLSYEPSVIQSIVEEMSSHLNRDFINARLEVDAKNGLIIVPGVQGQKVDVDATFAGMPSQWEEFTALQIPIVLKKTEPVVNEEQLKEMGELASFTTWYKVSEVARSHNLALAARAVNGTAVPAGEEFSFNRTVGERTYQNGYQDAMIINNGLFEPGLGGGICQVSSTIYNAVLLAGMEITERHNHSLAVTYVPLGRDATVAYGIQDFKFKNNTNYPIYIRATAGGGGLIVNIYGHLDYKQNISVTNVVDRVINFTEVTEVKADLAPGTEFIEQQGLTGYQARAFRNFLDENGQIIKTEQLSSDYYRPVNRIKFIGPSAEVPVQTPVEGELPGEENPIGEELPGGNQNETLPGEEVNFSPTMNEAWE